MGHCNALCILLSFFMFDLSHSVSFFFPPSIPISTHYVLWCCLWKPGIGRDDCLLLKTEHFSLKGFCLRNRRNSNNNKRHLVFIIPLVCARYLNVILHLILWYLLLSFLYCKSVLYTVFCRRAFCLLPFVFVTVFLVFPPYIFIRYFTIKADHRKFWRSGN